MDLPKPKITEEILKAALTNNLPNFYKIEKRKKRIKVALAIVLMVISISLLLIVIFIK